MANERIRTRTLLLFAAFALFAAACGGGGDDDEAGTTTPTTAEAAVTATTAEPAATTTSAPATTSEVEATTTTGAPVDQEPGQVSSFVAALGGQVPDEAPPGSVGGGDPMGTGTGARAAYADYVTITDDSGALVVDVPTDWAEVDGRPISETTADVRAAPDLAAYAERYDVSGMQFTATTDADEAALTPDEVLDVLTTWSDACTVVARDGYDDGLYAGSYEFYEGCGGTGAGAILVVARPEDGSFTIEVAVQVLTDADLEALDRVLQTFVVDPEAFGAAFSFPEEVVADGTGGAGPESYDEYVVVTDDSGALSVDVPTAWVEVDGQPVDELTLDVSAAPDLVAYDEFYDAAGMTFTASWDPAYNDPTLEQLLAEIDVWRQGCTVVATESYADPLYLGLIELYADCGLDGEGTADALVVVARPDDLSFTTVVTAQMVSPADFEAAERVLNSFVVDTSVFE